MQKSFKRIIIMVCLAIMFNSNVIAKAEGTVVMPIPIPMCNSNNDKGHVVKSIEEGTAILHKDGTISDLIVNKNLKNPPVAGDLENGDKRIEIVVGMDNEVPVTYAEKDSKGEEQLRQLVKGNESMAKNIIIAIIFVTAIMIIFFIIMGSGR